MVGQQLTVVEGRLDRKGFTVTIWLDEKTNQEVDPQRQSLICIIFQLVINYSCEATHD